MAKKKATKKKTVRRRRRMGALDLKPENPIVKFGAVAVGLLMAKPINESIDKLVGTGIDPKIIAAVQAGGGGLLAFKLGKKNLIATVAGGVLAGAGARRLMTQFGIGGLEDIPRVNGYQAIPAVSGYQAIPAVSGIARFDHLPKRPAINGANYGLYDSTAR